MTPRPDTDPLDRIETLQTIQADGQDVPWVLLTVEQRDALVAVARAAQEMARHTEQPINLNYVAVLKEEFEVLVGRLARLDKDLDKSAEGGAR